LEEKMKKRTLSRREFIRLTLLTSAGGVLASCAPAATATTTPTASAATATTAPAASATTAPVATATTALSATVGAPEVWTAKVTVPAVAKKFDGVQISTYYPGHAAYKYFKSDTETDNVFSKRQKKNLGVEYTLWSEGGNEAYKADIASNKLPDKWSAIQTDLIALVGNDQVEDITDLWEKNAFPLLKEKKQYPLGKGWVPCGFNGRLYGIAVN